MDGWMNNDFSVGQFLGYNDRLMFVYVVYCWIEDTQDLASKFCHLPVEY